MIVIDLILNGAQNKLGAIKDIEGEFSLEEYVGVYYKEITFYLVEHQKYASAMRLCFNNSDMELLEYVKHERAERFRKCFKAMKNFVSRKESAPKELDRLLQNKLPEGDLVKGCIIHTENAKPHAMKNCSLDIIVSYIRKHTVDTCFILEFEAQLVFVYNWK